MYFVLLFWGNKGSIILFLPFWGDKGSIILFSLLCDGNIMIDQRKIGKQVKLFILPGGKISFLESWRSRTNTIF